MEKPHTATNTPVVIMAGGYGNRLQPYTHILPKPLLIYKEETMLENVIHLFAKHGFKKFYIVLYYKKELIVTYLDNLALPYDIHYVYETTPMGTVGGLKLLEQELDSDFVLCNCDNFGDFDYNTLIRQHMEESSDLTILVKKHTHTIPFGIVDGDGCNIVLGIREKPSISFFISTGIHIVNPRVFSFIRDGECLDMPSFINSAAKQLKLRMEDIGDSPWVDMSLVEQG